MSLKMNSIQTGSIKSSKIVQVLESCLGLEWRYKILKKLAYKPGLKLEDKVQIFSLIKFNSKTNKELEREREIKLRENFEKQDFR